MRAADYDDWITDTSNQTNRETHGLNGDILVWNHVTQRRHELSSMGIRVNAETLRKQLEMSNLLDNLKFPYHQGIINNVLQLSIGGGVCQSRTLMLLLRKAHLGEVSVTVWPKNPEGDVRQEEHLGAGIIRASRNERGGDSRPFVEEWRFSAASGVRLRALQRWCPVTHYVTASHVPPPAPSSPPAIPSRLPAA
jgi:hypothetical protein